VAVVIAVTIVAIRAWRRHKRIMAARMASPEG
jgi:hypothetical protein